jgi:hypothetical protein
MKELLVAGAEILVKPGDLPSGNTKAFVNAVTWADSSNNAEKKVSQCLKSDSGRDEDISYFCLTVSCPGIRHG